MEKNTSQPRKFTDLQIYSLLKKGDENSLNYIHTRYRRLLFWLGKQIIDDDFAVETIVQDTFLKLWFHRNAIEAPEHILGFLRFVLKRDCLTYISSLRGRFARLTSSLESFENYQDYLVSYDPAQDTEHLRSHESEQKNFDELKKVLHVLDAKRKHLIELCLEYGFQYKPIAEAMGSSVKDISNEVGRAIDDLKKILNRTSFEPQEKKESGNEGLSEKLSSRQHEIFNRRMEHKASFAVIARELKLPEKEVHREFLYAYQYLQNQNIAEILL